MNRKHKSYLAQYHCGILPLTLQKQVSGDTYPQEDKSCKLCGSLVIEDEYHFIFHCSLYKNIRDLFFLNIYEMNEVDNMNMFMSKELVGYFAKIISEMIEVRHDKLW